MDIKDINNDTSTSHSLTDNEMAGMVLNQSDSDDRSDSEDNIINMVEKVSMDS